MDQDFLLRVEQQIGYHFSTPALLQEALVHSSSANTRLASNERLEFLGDAVLGMIICRALFDRFPDYLEGDLTKIKSMVVSRKVCAKLAGRLDLPGFIQVGKGTDRSRAMNGSIAAGTLEAVIAAIYLDGGLEAAQEFVLRLFGPYLDRADANGHHDNFKSILQQYCQRYFNSTPTYELLDEKGPDHNKCFEVAAVVRRRHFPSAWGVTKKEAEQKAALKALRQLGVLDESGAGFLEPKANSTGGQPHDQIQDNPG